ncbi:MAG: hypothetical protein Q9204_002545 [Flavoplaca sp. TL-2023a]
MTPNPKPRMLAADWIFGEVIKLRRFNIKVVSTSSPNIQAAMHSLSVALFAAGALAGNLKLHQLVPRELQIRQSGDSQAFNPSTSFGQGESCADAFGSGYIDCNGVCYNPDEDQTCCSGGGDGYPCPAESFCLNVDGLCCPEGLDPASCAAQFGVELPAESESTSPIAGSTTVASSTVSAVESSVTDTSSAFVPSTTATTFATPYPTGNATDSAIGAAPTGAGGNPVPFTGGASNVQVGLAAGLLGAFAMLL